MWSLLLSLAVTRGPSDPGIAIQRPSDAVSWAFEWDAPPECPNRAQVIESVRAYVPNLEDPPAAPTHAVLRVQVSISSDGADWTATLLTSGRDGASERRFSGTNCIELAAATALVTAVALDPVVTARGVAERVRPTDADAPSHPSPSPVPVAPSAATPRSLPVVENSSRRADDQPGPRARTVRLGAAVFGTGAWAPTKNGFGGVGVSFAVFDDRWRWEIDGSYMLPHALSLDDGRRGSVQAWWIGTRGCLVLQVAQTSPRTLEFPVCGGIEAGQVQGRGLAPTRNPSRATQLWVAVAVGPGLRWPFVPNFALMVDVQLLAALVRGGRFLIDDQTLTEIAPVGFAGILGLEARF